MTNDRLQRALAGRYEIGEVIGRGGMGTVLVARDARHGRDVAIKVLDSSDASPDARARFLREVRVTAGLAHPGIVPLFDSGDAEGLLYYVMPRLGGESLRERMRRQPLTPAQACTLLADVADALDLAHRNGIVHRDVKPENILLVEGRPVLMDFGVAYVADGDARTQAGVMVGTLLYLAPEQLSGDAPVDRRADVFAIGCILYEALAGAAPHASSSIPQLLARRASEPAELPPAVAVPDAVRAVVNRALERDPAKRFETASALASALRAAAEPSGVSQIPAAPPTTNRRRLAIGAAVVVALAVTAAVVLPRYARADDASIAVLPFANASGDRELAYFSDGVSEELLSAISDISGVRALSRSSTEGLRGKLVDPRAIAAKLGVTALLEGSVRRSGDDIRVVVSLIDGRTGYQRWSHTYDASLRGLFQVQDSIARAVAGELRVRLASGAIPVVGARTTNPAVHDLVLRARYLDTPNRADHLRALAIVDSAITMDSLYAAAWALRSRLLGNVAIFRDSTDADMLRQARDAAVRAAALDSSSAEARAALATQLFRYDWDWAAAERELRRAIELNPARAETHGAYARFLRSMGRFDEARERIRQASALDPSQSRAIGLGRISYFAHDFERARRDFAQATRADSAMRTWIAFNAEVLLGLGRFAAAESLLTIPDRNEPLRPVIRVALYARTGRAPLARQLTDSLLRARTTGAIQRAEALAAIGETQRALDAIDDAIATHDTQVVDLKVEPLLDPLRAEPRFQAVLRKLRFPP